MAYVRFDVEIDGGMGLYTVWGNSKRGIAWVGEHLCYENWQGRADAGVTIEGTGNAQEITDGAFADGLRVAVNGRRYIGNGYVAPIRKKKA